MTEDHARLACGRDPGALVDQVADGSPFPVDDHQRSCPHCQAALAEFQRLWGPVRAVADHQPRAPEGVVDEALRSIRGVSADPEYGRIEGSEGRTRISARVVVRLARHLAGRVPGVRVALSGLVAAGGGPETRLDPTLADPDASGDAALRAVPQVGPGSPGVVAGVAGHSTVVEITLAADYGQDLVALAARIRAVVAEGIRRQTGLEPVAVLVHIDDIFV
jgi:hypothetical protein